MESLSTVLGELGNPKTFKNRDWDKHRYDRYTGASRRTYEPVRRFSRLAGRCEAVFWRPTNRQEVRRIVLAAERYELATKEAGNRNGALGHIAIEILRYMANLVDFRTGRLEPCLDTLMAKLCRSRDAIHRALKALRQHGFLDWLRRYVPTGNEGEGQPQVQQTSNAYRMMIPQQAKRFLGRYGQSAPIPEDFEHRQEQDAAEYQRHRESLPLDELPLFDMGEDNPLAQSLSRLGKLVKERESAKRSESPSQISFNRKNGQATPDSD